MSSKSLRLTEQGLHRLMSLKDYPQHLPFSKLLYSHIEDDSRRADLERKRLSESLSCRISHNTVRRILQRQKGCNYSKLESIYRTYGDSLRRTDYESVPTPLKPTELPLPAAGTSRPRCLCRASPDDLKWVAALEADLYHDLAVPYETLHRWYSINPLGFFIMKAGETRIGQITIMPVNTTVFEPFQTGSILETELPDEAFYAPSNRHLVRNLYVESLIVSTNRYAPLLIVLEMAHVLIEDLLDPLCDPASVERIFALGATFLGDELLADTLGFNVVQPAEHRRADPHHFLYVSKFDQLCSVITRYSDIIARRNVTNS